MSSRLLHLICDYGVGDPAFSEVVQRLLHLYPDFSVVPLSVPKFNTVATGFWIYQLALGDHPEDMMIFSNTAPRKDKKEKRENNHGEPLLYAKLNNGVEILAVHAGYCFSFIKPFIKELKMVNVANQGSQFRSRDFYPQAVAAVAKQDKSILLDDYSIEEIPELSKPQIAWVDGYGNIKTTMRRSSLAWQPGTALRVKIGKMVWNGVMSGGSFEVPEGTLAVSSGSSGYDDPFVELFLRGKSAYQAFGNPEWSTPIQLEAA